MIDFGFDLAGKKEPQLARGVVWSSLGAILDAAPLLVVFFVLDRVFAGRSETVSILWVTIVLGLLLVASCGFRCLGAIDNFTATYRLVTASRLRLADHLRRLPMGFFEGKRKGALTSVLTDEYAVYTEIATHAWSMTVANLALPMALAVVLFLADWRLALVAMLPIPVAFAAIPWSISRINNASDALAAQHQELSGALVEYVDGLETLQALDAGRPFRERIATHGERLSKQQMRTELAPAPSVLGFGLLVNASFGLVLVVGALGHEALGLPPARFLLVALLSAHFSRTLAELVIYLSAIRFATRTLSRVRALFAQPTQEEGLAELRSSSELAIEDASFAYGHVPVLQGVTAGFPEGTVTALVGPSGSGKSTLAALLCRLWDVEDGRVELAGVDLRDLPSATVHREVATIFQDVVLFQETVLDNLRLGDATASPARVVEAARAAGAHEFIEALPDGYETVLGPNGEGLSGGERQRLAIARALLKDAPVLVLDEATASVDPDREYEIQRAIAELMRGRTVIVVAHRLWTIRDVDQILVIDEGRIVQRGSHEQLIGKDGMYKTLWTAQQEAMDWSISNGLGEAIRPGR